MLTVRLGGVCHQNVHLPGLGAAHLTVVVVVDAEIGGRVVGKLHLRLIPGATVPVAGRCHCAVRGGEWNLFLSLIRA